MEITTILTIAATILVFAIIILIFVYWIISRKEKTVKEEFKT